MEFLLSHSQSCFVLSKHFLVFILLGKKQTEEKIFFSGSPHLFHRVYLISVILSLAVVKSLLKYQIKKLDKLIKRVPCPRISSRRRTRSAI
jgi:hypothetical protein